MEELIVDAAAVAKWVADYERDFGRPGARRVIASSASAAEPQDDYAALFNDDVNALDRQRAVAASRAASLTDDQLYREIFGDDDGEPRPSASHPDGRPYVRVPRPAAAWPMSDYSPVFANGKDPFSATAAGTIVGGTFVEAATAGAVQQSSLNSTKIAGIAAHDAASGQWVSVWPIDGMVHEITHTAGGSVGDTITSLASGLAASTTPATAHAAGTDLGVALTTATAGNKIRFIGR